MKRCNKCGVEKDLTAFPARTENKDGFSSTCYGCTNESYREYYLKNKDHIRELHKIWQKNNVLKMRESNKKCYLKHAKQRNLKNSIWRKSNPEKVRIAAQKWRDSHGELVRSKSLEKSRKYRATLKGRLRSNISRRINDSLVNGKNGKSCLSVLGYSISELREYLEKQFTPQMNWQNYGSYWEIDHKIPVAVFNFETMDDIDFKRCWTLGNLQPLKKSENRRKNAKLYKPFQPALAMGGAL